MRKYQYYILTCCLVLVLAGIVVGCSRDSKSSNPTSPGTSSSAEEKERSAGTLSDDTEGSSVDSGGYSDETTVIVAIGDSITYGQGTSTGGYPTILQSRLSAAGYTVTVINAGIRGEQTASTESRFLEEIAGADIVLLMIGTNDVVNPGVCEEAFNCETVEHIASMLDLAIISEVTPIVSTIPPANPDGDYAWANATFWQINNSIVAEAAARGVTTVDNYAAITNNGGSALYSDRLHFTQSGYTIIAEQWYTAILPLLEN